ncbi:MAG: hypothetical protein E7426_02490 [Ruminococcaceae bacterium]|jgi:hypothetical protein|nr:hypothetical protein [Oscillospiraceae bacterium]
MREKRIPFSAITVVLLVLAVGLLLFSTIGGARAALGDPATYSAEVSMKSIGLVLNENGTPIEDGKLLSRLLSGQEDFVPGKSYDEVLTVSNTGKIDEYVRLTIYRYWLGENGKRTDLDPALIRLTLGTDGWVEDKDASTAERTVLYYTKPLEAEGDPTSAALTAVMVDNAVATGVQQVRSGNTITTIYAYDGMQFGLEIEVDGVQTHNAADAILSAWGIETTVGADGTLSLN